MRDRLLVLGWLAGLIVLSGLHDFRMLALGAALAALAAGRRLPSATDRAALAVGLFGGSVALAYVAFALWRGDPPFGAAAGAAGRLLLRAFALALLTFGILPRIDPDRLFARSPLLRSGARVALAQIGVFRRVLADARLAFESRRLGRLPRRARLAQAGSAAGGLVVRALHDAEEVTLAMEARGLLPPERDS